NAANFYHRMGEPAKAEQLLRRLLDPKTRAPETTVTWARRVLAVVLASDGNYLHFREALALLEENSKATKDAMEDRQAQGLVLATQPSRRRDAIRVLEGLSADQRSPSADVQFALAQLYEAEGEWAKAWTHMLTLLQTHDSNPVYLARFVRAWLRQ